jgi:polar amino acid transport system ATP-binding protein
MLKIKNLSKTFQDQIVLKDVSFDLEKSKTLCLIGRSGCGKSTLLRCIMGLEKPDTGTLITPDYGKIGFVFQNYNLFSHLNLLDNVALALKVVQKKSKKEAELIATECIEKVGLLHRLKNLPRQLSGGEQQRGAIARALALKPELMLYDEPTSALDPELVDEVLLVIKNLAEQGMTQVIVTHEMRFARQVSHEIIFLDQGQMVEWGPTLDFFNHTQEDKTKLFLKSTLNDWAKTT